MTMPAKPGTITFYAVHLFTLRVLYLNSTAKHTFSADAENRRVFLNFSNENETIALRYEPGDI